MCGRYTITLSWEELAERFLLDRRSGNYQPRYNVAPGQLIPAIIGGAYEAEGEPEHRFGQLQWGLVPSWSSDDSSGFKMINARSETVAEKRTFSGLLERKRCLIPADGFYEWRRSGSGKQPVRFVMKSGDAFGIAALYDTWVDPNGSKLHTCTLLTTAANALVSEVHERMPVILSREGESRWLDRRIRDPKVLGAELEAYPAEEMDYYEVSAEVGRASYDEPDCIQPITLDRNET